MSVHIHIKIQESPANANLVRDSSACMKTPKNLQQINARNIILKVNSVCYNTVPDNTGLYSFV